VEDGPKILIIEDNEDWRRITAASVQEAEYQVAGGFWGGGGGASKDIPGLGLNRTGSGPWR